MTLMLQIVSINYGYSMIIYYWNKENNKKIRQNFVLNFANLDLFWPYLLNILIFASKNIPHMVDMSGDTGSRQSYLAFS